MLAANTAHVQSQNLTVKVFSDIVKNDNVDI